MAVTYTWTIAELERNTADGGVTVAHWRCEGVDEEATASSYGTSSWTPDASASDFIAFADLTQDAVLAWVWNTVVRADIEQAIADKINAELNPTTTAGVPW
jgi:hypothetical protein